MVLKAVRIAADEVLAADQVAFLAWDAGDQPGLGCGKRTHTFPDTVATSIARDRSITSS